jgi:hypothetical protein
VGCKKIAVEGQQVLLFLTREDTLTGDTNSTHYKVIAAPNAAYQIQGGTATTIAGSQSIELETLLGEIRQFSSR